VCRSYPIANVYPALTLLFGVLFLRNCLKSKDKRSV